MQPPACLWWHCQLQSPGACKRSQEENGLHLKGQTAGPPLVQASPPYYAWLPCHILIPTPCWHPGFLRMLKYEPEASRTRRNKKSMCLWFYFMSRKTEDMNYELSQPQTPRSLNDLVCFPLGNPFSISETYYCCTSQGNHCIELWTFARSSISICKQKTLCFCISCLYRAQMALFMQYELDIYEMNLLINAWSNGHQNFLKHPLR